MIRRTMKSLRHNCRGNTMMEFAIVAPVLLTLTFAGFDLGYRTYIGSTLQGVVEKAGRDATLEGGAAALSSIDAKVYSTVHPLVDQGVFTFTRKNYESFSRAGQAENFTDGNSNGIRDPGECFQDENGNRTWDTDSGSEGVGGARDIVVYTAKVKYERLFPMYGLLGWSQEQTSSATTVLRNQPFATQNARNVTAVCT